MSLWGLIFILLPKRDELVFYEKGINRILWMKYSPQFLGEFKVSHSRNGTSSSSNLLSPEPESVTLWLKCKGNTSRRQVGCDFLQIIFPPALSTFFGSKEIQRGWNFCRPGNVTFILIYPFIGFPTRSKIHLNFGGDWKSGFRIWRTQIKMLTPGKEEKHKKWRTLLVNFLFS